MIEAMSCGTPVLAFRNGSVPEVLDEGVTGCVVSTLEDAIRTVPKLLSLDRRRVRRRFEERFVSGRMARDYLEVYRALSRDESARPHTSQVRGTAVATVDIGLH
jgi:glycosyltransferase involved in cell wall biosynthesis